MPPATFIDFAFAHLGVAVPDLAQAISTYHDLFGYQMLSGPFDDPIQQVSVCFIGTAGKPDLHLELVAPLGAGSPVGGILDRGGGAYHVCYTVPNLEKAIAAARDHRCILISGPTPAVAYGGRHIAWLYLPSRQLVELLERNTP